MALGDVVRSDERERIRVCAADDCEAVLVDLSRNRSPRYCDTGNCGNRANVAAHRARRASVEERAGLVSCDQGLRKLIGAPLRQ